MKKLLLSILTLLLITQVNAQMYSPPDENKDMALEYQQWTADSAGYCVALTNKTDIPLEVEIYLQELSIDTVVTINAHSYDIYQVGYKTPYIEGMMIKARVTQSGRHFTLSTKIIDNPYNSV
jgi:hypothetical protein